MSGLPLESLVFSLLLLFILTPRFCILCLISTLPFFIISLRMELYMIMMNYRCYEM